jgi:DNA processing protein
MPLSASRLDPLLRLALVQGVGPQRFALLTERFGSVESTLGASVGELAKLPGIGSELARRISEAGNNGFGRRVDAAMREIERVGAVAFDATDPLYPQSFRVLADPPFLLFAAGDTALLTREGVAMVGTRAPTLYGRDAAKSLASGLAWAGFGIISGMARGIDTIAHRAALDAGGHTIGVLGHGIGQVYPPENRGLFAAVRDRGLLLTELPPGEKPLAGNFPRRNRLIAALSQAVLVVEMGFKSGAQHTVTYALELGKEVMAVPGPISVPSCAGTNQLIRDGAVMVTCADDVIDEIRGVGAAASYGGTDAAERAPAPMLSAEEQRLLALLGGEPAHVDELAGASRMGVGILLSALLDLELKGLAEPLPGSRYRRR